MIRSAKPSDIQRIAELLLQVHAIHAEIHPEIFASRKRKYSDEQILALIEDECAPIFVFEDKYGAVQGYVFCSLQITRDIPSLIDRKVLFIDDLCVDESQRGQKIGKYLYQHAVDFARENQCDSVSLYVWNGNQSALQFYERLGLQPLKTLMEQKL